MKGNHLKQNLEEAGRDMDISYFANLAIRNSTSPSRDASLSGVVGTHRWSAASCYSSHLESRLMML
jgi:hypothetical protein